MSHRERVADFWDAYLLAWIKGDERDSQTIQQWRSGYRGTGRGVVDLESYPDPFVGDLRGLFGEPRIVVLGLNPGVGYPELQGRNPPGIWTQRIAEESYSRCMSRVPYGDDAWRKLHGRDSAYWVKLVNFARRWTDDSNLPVSQILSMEMYPWHSEGLEGSAIRPPAHVIKEFVWDPIGDIDVPAVFAFSTQWLPVCESLGLKQLAWYGPGQLRLIDPTNGRWSVRVFALPSGQALFVSWQLGNANPPGGERIDEFRRIVGAHAIAATGGKGETVADQASSVEWSSKSFRGLEYDQTDELTFALATCTQLIIGEGGAIYEADRPDGYYLVSHEGAALDMLEPEDRVGLSPYTVRRFRTDADRDEYLQARERRRRPSRSHAIEGAESERQPRAPRSPVETRGIESRGRTSENAPLSEIERRLHAAIDGATEPGTAARLPGNLLQDVRYSAPLWRSGGPLWGARPLSDRAGIDALVDWRPRYLLAPRRGMTQIVTDRVIVHVNDGLAPSILRAHVLATRAEAREWPAGQRLVCVHQGERRYRGWLADPIDASTAQEWLDKHQVSMALEDVWDHLPPEISGVSLAHSIAEGARWERAWSTVTEELAAAATMTVKLGGVSALSWGAYYVQLTAGQPGLLEGEAVSNAYLGHDAQLDPVQIQTLTTLGWRWPVPDVGRNNFWRTWKSHEDPHSVATILAMTLRTVYRAWPQTVKLQWPTKG